MIPFGLLSRAKTFALPLVCVLLAAMAFIMRPACAEQYQSRLNKLLIHPSNLYLPSRLVLGEATRFVVKAQPGSLVRVLISTTGEGYQLPNGTPLRVGQEVQELSGTVPAAGVLELMLEMPKEESLAGRVVYVDAVAGPSDEALEPINLVDSTGRRTESNTLVITKAAEVGGPMVMPGMPGFNPQVFSQLTTLGDVYNSGDERKKQLLDNGNINKDREMDQNPFIRRGAQQGISY